MAGIVSAANLGGIVDPRSGDEADAIGTTQEHRGSISHQVAPPDLHGHRTIYLDSSIKFEDYHYWAKRSREVEKHIVVGDLGFAGIWNLLTGRNGQSQLGQKSNKTKMAHLWAMLNGETSHNEEVKAPVEGKSSPSHSDDSVNGGSQVDEKHAGDAVPHSNIRTTTTDKWGISETEWEHAQRSMRTATWGSIFYLITTDILGPNNVPWAISQMGFGPGAALYTVFGIMACYSGLQLWKIFIGLDSTRYPMRNYGDVAFRIYGSYARIGVNVLQSFQFFLNIVLLIESNGQGLAQMAVGKSGNGFLCFVVAELIFMLLGFIFGQIRTLQRLSFLANIAIWLNVIVIISTMGVVYSYSPNYEASLSSYGTVRAPVRTEANWPKDSDLKDKINGLMNCVFAYGGATLFNELMAEMRRPMDFWKGFILAEIFIYVCYIVSGMVIYNAQGQFTFNPSYQGIPNSAYSWQTLGNAISFITGLIAALLYGNIGIKVFYSAVLRDVFKFPPLDQKTGKWLWVAIVPVYWALAFVIAAAIPQISNLTSFVGAACILQFSYTFPPMLLVGYNVQKDAMLPEEQFDPLTGDVKRVDTGLKRMWRGYKVKWHINTFDVLYSIAALGTAGLGLYASTLGMHDSFQNTSITPFSCHNPAG